MSATTRAPRPGEVNGVHYWFVSDEEFDAMVAEDELLEWAVVHKAARYGTPRGPVEARPRRRHARACSRSTSRAPGRCARPCPRPCSSSSSRRRGTSWYAGWSAAAPRPRPSASAGSRPRAPSWRPRAEFDVTIVNHEVHAAAERVGSLDVLVGPIVSEPRSDSARLHHRVCAQHRRRGRHQPLDRRPAHQDRQQVQARALQRQACPPDQRLLLPARRGPARVRRPAGRHPRPGEAALDRAARDQRRPADLRGRRPRRAAAEEAAAEAAADAGDADRE